MLQSLMAKSVWKPTSLKSLIGAIILSLKLMANTSKLIAYDLESIDWL